MRLAADTVIPSELERNINLVMTYFPKNNWKHFGVKWHCIKFIVIAIIITPVCRRANVATELITLVSPGPN